MTPDQTRSPSLVTVVRAKISERLEEVHVALPGRVESYDKDTQLVDVTPLVKKPARLEDGSIVAEQLPVLAAVPVQFPSGGGMRIVLPLKQGDTGWIMFSEASLDAWRAQGGLVDPQDMRRFHLSDATFLPGLHAKDNPLTIEGGDDLSMGKDGAHQVVITPDAIELGGNGSDRPTDMVALASLVKSEAQKIVDAIKSVNTTTKENNKLVAAHTHTVAEAVAILSDSLATMADPSDPADVGDVKSSIVKAK